MTESATTCETPGRRRPCEKVDDGPEAMTLATAPDLVTVGEAAAILRVGRTRGYQMVREGTLPALRLGRSLRIPRAVLERLVGSVDEASDDDTTGPDR